MMSNFKKTFLKIRENNFFEFFVISVIIISAITDGSRAYEEALNLKPNLF